MDSLVSGKPRALLAKFRKPCVLCLVDIEPGDEMYPCWGSSGYLHYACALTQSTATNKPLCRPVCKHWGLRGYCLLGDACFYTHPPSLARPLGHVPAPPCNFAAIQRCCNDDTRKENRGPGRRNKIRNRWKASVFRRFLLQTFGRELLRAGQGVLDVAGGKGELAFELLNLNQVPTTVLDPRPLNLQKYQRRLKLGVYHTSRTFQPYNHDRSAEQSATEGMLTPRHLRMFLDKQVLDALPAAINALEAVQRGERLCCTCVGGRDSYGSHPSTSGGGNTTGSSTGSHGIKSRLELDQDCDALGNGQHCGDAARIVGSTALRLGLSYTTADSQDRDSGVANDVTALPCRICDPRWRDWLRAVGSSTRRAVQVRWTEKGLTHEEELEDNAPCQRVAAAAPADPTGTNTISCYAVSSTPMQSPTVERQSGGLVGGGCCEEEVGSGCGSVLGRTHVDGDVDGDVGGDVEPRKCADDTPSDSVSNGTQQGMVNIVAASDMLCDAAEQATTVVGSFDAAASKCCSRRGLAALPTKVVDPSSLVRDAGGLSLDVCEPRPIVQEDLGSMAEVVDGNYQRAPPEAGVFASLCTTTSALQDAPRNFKRGAVGFVEWAKGGADALAMADSWATTVAEAVRNDEEEEARMVSGKRCIVEEACMVAQGGIGDARMAGTGLSGVDDEAMALEVLLTLRDCSAVVGLHPDQAAGAAADLALAMGKPFALVPCCVYAAEFQARRLACGVPVRTYEGLLQYLMEKDLGGTSATVLPFEGKNVAIQHFGT